MHHTMDGMHSFLILSQWGHHNIQFKFEQNLCTSTVTNYFIVSQVDSFPSTKQC